MNLFSSAFALAASDLGPALRKQTGDFLLNQKSSGDFWEITIPKENRSLQVSSATNREGELFLKLRTVVLRSEREVSPDSMLRLETIRLSGGEKAFFSLRWNGLHRGGKYGNESWEIILEQNIRLELLSEAGLTHHLKRFSGDAEEMALSLPVLIQP